jgi:hypothetical protein
MFVSLPSRRPRLQWTDVERRTVWWLISTARNRLGVAVDPVVATAFVILQRYFRGDFDFDTDLFSLIIAALQTSCKASSIDLPVSRIFSELARVCKAFPSNHVRLLFAVDELSDVVTPHDLLRVNRAELGLLSVIDFDYTIEIPFNYLNRWKAMIVDEYPQLVDQNWKMVMIDVCLMICSDYYLDVPPEVTAAVAACDVLGLHDWMRTVIERYGMDLWQLAMNSIQREKNRTAALRGPATGGG